MHKLLNLKPQWSCHLDDRLRFIGLVYKDIDEKELPFWSGFFDTPPRRHIAYAQAEVYNHLSEDTFTQDWRVRLEHATLLKSFLSKTGGAGLGSEFVVESLGTVNNH